MALTKVTGSVIKDSVSLSGNVSVGGTLTYQDVTNVDALGIGTFRTGIKVLAGQVDVGSNIKLGNAGVITATSFVGSGANLTGIDATKIITGNTQVQTIDTGSDGHIKFTTEGTERLRITHDAKIGIGTVSPAVAIHHFSDGLNGNSLRLENREGSITLTNDADILSLDANSFHFRNASGSTEKLRITTGGVLTFPTAGVGLHNSATNSYFFAHGSNETRLYHAANAQIKLSFRGSGDTLRGAISADASGIHILTAGSAEQKGVRCVTDGTTELYNNGIKKLDTVTTGIRVHGDEGGTAQLQLLADQGDDDPDYWRFIAETNGILNIQDYGSGSWYNNIRCTGNTGGVNLYHNNALRIETTSYGISIGQNTAGSISGQAGIEIGKGHTTSEIRLKNTSGGSGSGDGFGVQKWSDGNTYIYEYDPNNFIIGTNGVSRWIIGGTSGNLIPFSNNTVDIGTTSTRVRNIYTNDLHLSNEGSTNSVDNTWGNYTIQEGESDLYLINNRNGKKYKFNLTEVS